MIKKTNSIFSTLEEACFFVGILPKSDPRCGVFIPANTVDGRGGRGAGRILRFRDGLGGMVFNHRTGERALFFLNYRQDMPKKERDALMRKARAERERAEREAMFRREQREQVLPRVIADMFRNSRHGVHPYLTKKHVDDVPGAPASIISRTAAQALLNQVPPSIYEDGCLMTSLWSMDEDLLLVGLNGDSAEFQSCQFIDAVGGKRLMKGAPKLGLMWRPSDISIRSNEMRQIAIAEGVATALSVRFLFEIPCVAAIDCHNLKSVLEVVLDCYPNADICMMADRDKPTEKDPDGVGLEEAKAAVRSLSESCRRRVEVICVPKVNEEDMHRFRRITSNPKGLVTDFNDYQIAMQLK